MIPFEYFIGFRYLLSRKRNSFLSVITVISMMGVSVGVMALCIVLSAVSGFQNDFRQRILGNNAPLILFSDEGEIFNYEQLCDSIESVPGVIGASPFLYSEVLMMSDVGKSSGIVVYGVDPNRAAKATSLQKDIIEGSLDDLSNRSTQLPGIVVGKELASRQLYLTVGSTVNLIVPTGELTPFGFGPKMRRFEVVGIFKSGLYEYDSKSAYIALPDAQAFFGSPDQVKGVQINVANLDRAKDIASEVHKIVSPGYYIRHWMELNEGLFAAFQLEKTAFFIVVAMIVLVASFNIIGTLTLLVLTKVKEIAILKTMGATHRSIAKIFMFTGTFIGFIGTLVGLILGVIGCLALKYYFPFPLDANVYQVDHLPIRMDVVEFAMVAVCAVLISFLSTIYPATMAATLEPSEGIRND